MFLEIFRHRFPFIDHLLDAGMGNVARHDQRALDIETGLDRILRQRLAYFVHTLVEIELDGGLHIRSFLRQEAGRIFFKLFEENTVCGNFRLDVAVGAATHADTDRAGRRMARESNDAHVVHEVFAAELGTHAALLANFQDLLLPLQVAERATALVAAGRQVVEVTGRSLLYGREIRLGRRTADHDGQVVRRTSRRAEVHDMRFDEISQILLGEQRFGLLVEERFVGRSPALGDKQELVFVARSGVKVDLGRQVSPAVLLLGHRERHHLRIAQVPVAVSLVNAFRQHLGVIGTGVHVLALLADHDRRTGILAGGQFALGRYDLVDQHRVSDKLIVVSGFGILEDVRQFLQVCSTQVERYVGKSLFGKQFQTFGVDLKHFASVAFDHLHVILREQAILRCVGRQRKRLLILEL